ncbi:ABC-2 transporter permease [Acetivibrio mesophilus]|uniref:ABC-2 transporter permease n=1 Tax=Acetivibrio mesophilus TaxID=2487273 RepID=A0A4Q0I339_9FIRM|nr:ABC-2 transporter permease [Acetivibrio mesophilus]RXE58157.1 ABC-2 transporter permease [Acetivibrio mesophilus]
MKALLLKDFYTLIKQIKIYIVMIIVFACIPGNSIAAIAMVYAAMLPITALAYDERSKWDSLALMMPYSDRSIVLSKYILGYIAVAAAFLISIVAQIAITLIKNTAFEPEGIVSLILIACIATVVQAVNLPSMFKFGVEKGRLAFFVLVGIITGVGMVIGDRLAGFLSTSYINIITAMLVTVIFTLAINLISIALSTRIYKKRV